MLASFGTLLFWGVQYPLTADVTFAILMLVGTLRAYLTQLPIVISRLIQAKIALKRIEAYLHSPDMVPSVEHTVEGETAYGESDGCRRSDGNSPY